MEFDRCYTIDFSKSENDKIFAHLRETLIADGYVKVKCDNILDDDYEKACLDIIRSVGDIYGPYNDNPNALI
jgi:hypothetical protein